MNRFGTYNLPVRFPCRSKQGKALYRCSKDKSHRITLNTARSSGWMCTHCGAELAERKNKVAELERLALELGYEVKQK